MDYFVLKAFFLTSLSFVPQCQPPYFLHFRQTHPHPSASIHLLLIVSCLHVIICELAFALYQVRQMHIHRQPDAFDYCYLQGRPEPCMSQFGNLFLYTEFCVFLHHNLFLLCLKMSSCIFRPCHSSINTTCEVCLERANSPIRNLWLPQCIFIVVDPKARISYQCAVLCDNFALHQLLSLCGIYTSIFLL